MKRSMRIVVVGSSGLIGNKVMTALHDAGHHAVAASPAFGIDAYTREGLDEAMAEPTSSSTSPTLHRGETRGSSSSSRP
jgi:dihydrodipicolinate reductase